jgi:hypothetical protein
MSPAERIFEMLRIANSDTPNFPPTILYNEGWLLRLVLDWFSRRDDLVDFPLHFAQGSRWFSEALLPSQFLARYQRDNLAEGYTHADGVVGHVTIGTGALANTTLVDGASQFLVTEAKLFSPLSAGVTHARDFDQTARNVACIAEVLRRADRHPRQLASLGFFVVAPTEQIEEKQLFRSLLSQASIREKVSRRVSQFAGSPDEEKKNRWFRDWFEPTLGQIKLHSLAWEEIINLIRGKDAEFGSELFKFYDQCLQFNRIQEPERTQ